MTKPLLTLYFSINFIIPLTSRIPTFDAVRWEYDAILKRVRNVPILHVDETSIEVQGKKHWIWAFTTPAETFVAIRKSGAR